MKTNLRGFAAFSLLAAVVVAAAFSAGYVTHGRQDQLQTGSFGLLVQVRDILRANYIGDAPGDTAFEYGAAHGMVGALNDPYSRFVEPPAHELESQDLQGAFGGVGAELRLNPEGEVVLSPYPDLPAAKAGIEEGDVLLQVDDTPITPEISLDDVSALIRGPVGTKVRLTIRHEDEAPRVVTIERQEFEIPSVTWRQLEDQPDIGLIAISRFSSRTDDEFRRAYQDLSGKGVTGVVLDLRDDSGGLLDASIQVAGEFLDGGVVAYEQRRNGGEEQFPASGRGLAADIPLAVLVNHGTASAAEVVAGALLDRQRAPLIGEKSYGKGSVQLVFDLPDGSSVHVTAARWYTPLHTPIDGVGLTPTIETAPRDGPNDPPLERAIEYLTNGS
jgi:carboxyl-terminal processing protease